MPSGFEVYAQSAAGPLVGYATIRDTCMVQPTEPLDFHRIAVSAILDVRHADALIALVDLMSVMQRSRLLTRSGAPATALLVHLAKHGPMRASELAGALHIDRSTLSRHLSRLVSDGLVARTVDPADARAHLVSDTEEGRRLAQAAIARNVATFEQVMATWSDPDLETFARLLTRFSQQFETRIVDGAASVQPPSQPERDA